MDATRESTLQQSDEKLRRTLANLPAGAYTCDADGLITYFNQRAVELWGREPRLNDPVDRFCGSFKLFTTEGASIPHDQCWMALALREQREFNSREIVIERPDGSHWTALAHANPFFDAGGRVCGAVNVLLDITERKQAEEAIRESDRRKSEFLAVLAHELRNPLTPVRNAISIMQFKGSAEPELQWCRDVIGRQVNHLTRLIDDLLDISRISRNKLELREARVELTEIIHGAVEMSRPLIEQCDHTLTVSLPGEPVYLQADLVRLSQVFMNLLNNAAKYTEPGGHIRLTAAREAREVVVAVKDTGIGIPPENLPSLFEMFYQVDGSKERSQGGLGIGLSLVLRLVEMHGGSVTARSEGVGRGSEFIVRLPALATRAKASTAAHGAGAPSGARRCRVLVVDDNQDAALSLAILLHIAGHETQTAHDGLEAIDRAAAFRPDVVLLDVGLPKLNGHDVCRRIRQAPWGKSMVVVSLTGWGQDEDRQMSKDAGFDDHLVKPVALVDLLALLARRMPTLA